MFLNSQLIKLSLFAFLIPLLSSCGGGAGENDISSSVYQGVAQKGPFGRGSIVSLSQITVSGETTGSSLTTNIDDQDGSYTISLPANWGDGDSAFQINAKGYFLSELNGKQSENEVELTSIINDKHLLSLNILTQFEAQRIKALLQKGKSFKDAKQQSEKELAKIFGVNHFHELDVTRSDKLFSDNAQLLLLSGAIMEVAKRKNIKSQVIIKEMGEDFSNNGLLSGLGDDWFMRLQATIRDNPAAHINQYAKAFYNSHQLNSPNGNLLPRTVRLASRPVASAPTEIFAKPGETIVLDGSESHAPDGIVNFTWFRVDQLAFNIPFFLIDGEGGSTQTNARFSDAPSITVPNQETTLLFALVVTDSNDDTHTTVVKVIVKEPPADNHPPEAIKQDLVTNEDTPLAITLTGTDADGDVINFDVTTPVLLAHGILEGTAPNLTYTPDLNFNGTDSFIFSVNDGNQSSETAKINIVVNPVNDQPLAIGQNKTVDEGEELVLTLQGIDIDGDSLVFTHTDVSHGTLTGSGANLTYKPEANYSGPDSFTFTVNDGSLSSAPATVAIEVNPVNKPPVAVPQIDNDKVVTPEDTEISITLVGTDPNPADVANLTFIMESDVSQGVLSGTMPDLVYKPNPNYNDTDSFTFRVKDPSGAISDPARVDIVITPVNDLPTADPQVGVNKVVTSENIAKPITLSGSDVEDHPSALTYSLGSTSSLQGALTGSPPNLTYTPLSNFNGLESFTFTVTDSDGGVSSPATVEIFVTAVNDPPKANNQSFTIDEDQILSALSLDYSDIEDAKSALIYELITAPSHGALSGTAPSLTYTPALNNNSDVSFTYKITDSGGETATATVNITINPINDPPIAKDYTCKLSGAFTTHSINLSAFDFTDPEGDAITNYVSYIPNTNNEILILENNATPPLFITDGILTALPSDQFQSPKTTFEYSVKDEYGLESNKATVDVIFGP